MKPVLVFLSIILLFSCSKEYSSECQRWHLVYYEANAAGDTVYTYNPPWETVVTVCGAGKDTCWVGKRLTLANPYTNLYDYCYYEFKF